MDLVVWTNINIRLIKEDSESSEMMKPTRTLRNHTDGQRSAAVEPQRRSTEVVYSSTANYKLFIAMSGGNLDDDDDDNFLEDEEDERKGRIGGTHEEDEEEEVEEEEWEIDEDLGLKPEVLNTLRSWPSSSPLLK